jgi:hypothetical protein
MIRFIHMAPVITHSGGRDFKWPRTVKYRVRREARITMPGNYVSGCVDLGSYI